MIVVTAAEESCSSPMTTSSYTLLIFEWENMPFFWHSSWSVVAVPHSPLQKTCFPFPSRYQLQIASWDFVSMSCECWAFVWFEAGQGSCLLLQSVSSYVCQICCVWKKLFPWCHTPTSGFHNRFVSSSPQIPEPWWEWFDKDIPFRAERSKVPHALHIVQSGCGSLVITIFSDEGWAMLCAMGVAVVCR